jgi:hypothetical protein
MLTNPSYLGHRTSAGRVVVENCWPPLVDEILYNRVAGMLADPARRKAQDNRVKHLLSGLVVCEVCRKRLTFRQPHQTNGTLYWCQQGGHTATSADRLEAGVRRLITQTARPPRRARHLRRAHRRRPRPHRRAQDPGRPAGRGRRRARRRRDVAAGARHRRARVRCRASPRSRRCSPVPAARRPRRSPSWPSRTSPRWSAATTRSSPSACRSRGSSSASYLSAPSCDGRRRGTPGADLGLRFRWAGVGDVVEV